MTLSKVIGLMVFFTSACFADVTLEWQKDLSSDFGSYTPPFADSMFNSSKLRQFANDDVAVLLDGGGSNAVVVLNSNGDVIINDQFLSDFTPHFIGRASIEQFSLDLFVAAQRTIRIYEYDGITYTATNILAGSHFSISQFEGSISSVFYTLDGTVLSKYKISSAPIQIVGDVYSGIDGSNYKLTWNSIAGEEYQIQSTSNLTNWNDVGSTIIGTGDLLSWANALTNSSSFYRIIEK